MTSSENESFVLSKHAEQVMYERRIARDWVQLTLSRPQRKEPDKADRGLLHALRAIPDRGDQVLRVVYDPSSKPWRVITVFFDRRARRPL